jgi:hypothetical protein
MEDALETTKEARKRFERRVRILRVGITGMMWFALPGDRTCFVAGNKARYRPSIGALGYRCGLLGMVT